MKYRFQVCLNKGTDKEHWEDVHPTNGPPYEYANRAEAEDMARICYGTDASLVRVTEIDGPKVHNMRDGTAPADAVYIGRGSRWGNPYSHLPNSKALYICESRERAIEMFRYHVLPTLDLKPLRGKHLVCYCKPKACHGDLLLEAANAEV